MSDQCEEWMGEQFSFPIMAARAFGQTPILKLKMMDTFFLIILKHLTRNCKARTKDTAWP